MKPIPVVFHIGPLQIHTYGIGLAITFWFAYRYFARRLRAHGYGDEWLGRAFVWIIVAAIVGARAVHVIANWHFYSVNPGQIIAVWHGGLSSWGGLILGVPVGLWQVRRSCPKLRMLVGLDIVTPVLIAAWAVGRLLGPQLMIRGGGYRTTSWIGMYYAGEAGKRLPVPIFQAIECAVIWLVVIQIEKAVRRHGSPIGLVLASGTALWSLSRFFDEFLWLSHGAGGTAVEYAGMGFFILGALFSVGLIVRDRRQPRPALAVAGVDGADDLATLGASRLGDPWAAPAGPLTDTVEAAAPEEAVSEADSGSVSPSSASPAAEATEPPSRPPRSLPTAPSQG